MKHSLFLTALAAALLGGQEFAYSEELHVKDINDVYFEDEAPYELVIYVDAQKTLGYCAMQDVVSLTLNYQGDFVFTSQYINLPMDGWFNITTTVDAVKTKWEDAFSVDGGGSITLCSATSSLGESYGLQFQFFGKGANNTVQLGDSEVKFMGVVASKDALQTNEVGLVWAGKDISLVGKVEAPAPVPEPTTGTLSLLALAGLCARRRRK